MTVRTLTESPSLAALFARAALTQRGRRGDLPDVVLRREQVVVDRDHLLAYDRVCGFTGGDVLPHTYPHVLGFPLQVALMADRSFPLPLPGLVHLENQITVHRRLTADDRLTISVHAQDLRPHPKGRLVDLVTEVEVDGARVWDGRSTYLRRGHGSPDAPAAPAAPTLPSGEPAGIIRVPEGQGRAYAAVSGDMNPIHLHALSARAMGFPRAIAHGMWTAARTLAALEPRGNDASTSHVWFAKPVFLPSTVELVVDDRERVVVAGLRSTKAPATPHLTLTLAPR
ncbi:MaoC/PaaZ C-terminal domain-containing protein [Pedococcus badiiscoriae]|nr:MaoC/PaaZ C-terminal domain-containing protein [Pedococcus badiiscoriae]